MKTFLRTLITFMKKETVLSIAAILAIFSAFLVPPSAEYAAYIDFRVLALLFGLMLVVAGFQSIGLFHYLGTRILAGTHNTRQLILLLVALCFFSSMFITNDVALITFVPFAILILNLAKQAELLVPVIVLQTIGANLGSMFTPLGNPQNLYLYATFHIPIGRFLLLMLPLTVLSAILLVIAVFRLPRRELSLEDFSAEALSAPQPPRGKLICYLILFMVCLGCVVRLIPYPVMLLILILAASCMNYRLFADVDYFLLLTFLCFFVFIGNMERIPAISDFFHRILTGREMLLSVLLSQLISNVPAAILLSGFTDQSAALLYGVNIGGLGTIIASLASVISYRAYQNAACKKGYLGCFTRYNLLFLLILTIAGLCLLNLFGSC